MKSALIILISSILFLVSCGSAKTPVDRLVIAIESTPVTFDPRLAVDAYSMKIGELIFDGLLKMNKKFEFEPDLAESYEQLDDLTYKFRLKNNVVFHSGEPLTVDDVLYTYKSVLDGKIASPHKMSFDYIKEIEKEDDRTILVRLKEPFAPFLLVMTKGIIPRDYAEKMGADFGLKPVGTGPYRLLDYKSDSKILLEANDKYFGEKPRMAYLEFDILKDDNVRVLQLMRGSVDLVQNSVPPVLLGMLSKRKDITVDSELSIVFAYLGMNLQDPILSNINVRRALAHGINREEIVKYKWMGYAKIANTLMAPNHWAFANDVEIYGYDPELAKKLLDSAGFFDPDGDGPEMRFYLSFKTSTQKQRIDIASLMAEQLKVIGVGINVTPYEWGTFFRDIKNGDFQLYTLSWVGISDPDIYYNIFHSSQFPPSGSNRNRYSNARLDKLAELGRTTTDLERRRDIYGEVQRLVSEELPYIPLWYEDNVVVRRSDVLDYELFPSAGFLGALATHKE